MRYLLRSRLLVTLAGALLIFAATAGAAQANDQLAYVADETAGTITPVDLSTGIPGTPIDVGSQPDGIAITSDGSTAYVADYGSSTIVPVNLATSTTQKPISLPSRPNAIAITPNGARAYVVADSGSVWPITLSTRRLGTPFSIPSNADAIAIAPSGSTAYITDVVSATVFPLALPNGPLGSPINLEANTPDGIALTPDGSTAYIASNAGESITPLLLSSDVAGTPIQLGAQPTAIAITPDGGTAYVVDSTSVSGSGEITPINLETGIPGTRIEIGGDPSAIALVPPGGVTAGNGGSGNPGVDPGSATIGNQQLKLTTSGSRKSASGPSDSCLAPGSRFRTTLNRRTLGHGAKLKLRYITFRLGKQVKRAKRLPATERFSLKGLTSGIHTLTARVFYGELLAAHASGHGQHRKLSVTISRTLKRHISVC